jgi:transcriptional regulator with XRE-family HTH domain
MKDANIGQNLRRARIDCGLSQEKAARLLNYDKSSLSRKERGEQAIYAEEIVVFAQAYDRSIEFFFDDLSNGI